MQQFQVTVISSGCGEICKKWSRTWKDRFLTGFYSVWGQFVEGRLSVMEEFRVEQVEQILAVVQVVAVICIWSK